MFANIYTCRGRTINNRVIWDWTHISWFTYRVFFTVHSLPISPRFVLTYLHFTHDHPPLLLSFILSNFVSSPVTLCWHESISLCLSYCLFLTWNYLLCCEGGKDKSKMKLAIVLPVYLEGFTHNVHIFCLLLYNLSLWKRSLTTSASSICCHTVSQACSHPLFTDNCVLVPCWPVCPLPMGSTGPLLTGPTFSLTSSPSFQHNLAHNTTYPSWFKDHSTNHPIPSPQTWLYTSICLLINQPVRRVPLPLRLPWHFKTGFSHWHVVAIFVLLSITVDSILWHVDDPVHIQNMTWHTIYRHIVLWIYWGYCLLSP